MDFYHTMNGILHTFVQYLFTNILVFIQFTNIEIQ